MAGKFFGDWKQGEQFVTPTRTVTETDIVMFAAMTGDYNELHTSDEFMKQSVFGRRIGHGLQGLGLSHGLLFRTGFLEDTAIAFLEVDSGKFSAPFYVDDTIRVKFTVTETRSSRSKSDRGIVRLFVELINQREEVIQSGLKTFMIKRR